MTKDVIEAAFAELSRLQDALARAKESALRVVRDHYELVPNETRVISSDGKEYLFRSIYKLPARADFLPWIYVSPYKKDGTPSARWVTLYGRWTVKPNG